jgi:AraC-like DNA-binding protein/quercetin dioxygenase-like cupin family protein
MIKASYEVLQPPGGQSFLFRKFGIEAFDAPYHFHPEFELTYIVNGTGKRYVGSHMEDFSTGDLVLLGPNLPHCWKINSDQTEASAIVIQFGVKFLGESFFNCPELINIKKLFDHSVNGISFFGSTSSIIQNKLKIMSEERNNFLLLVSLLEILQQLANCTEYYFLDQQRFVINQPIADQLRINPVLVYLVENFRTKISLGEAADLANMTANAFCKYFKKITRKTFMETVIEYRLKYAVQQLVQTDKPISEISFESGFSDISNFYKTFKSKMRLSPLSYRKSFEKYL